MNSLWMQFIMSVLWCGFMSPAITYLCWWMPCTENPPEWKPGPRLKSKVPKTSIISMIFQWYFKTTIPNFHDNSERQKMKKKTVPHVKHHVLTHLTSIKGCFSKLKFPLNHPEMFRKCPFLYNILWLLIAQGQIKLAQPNLPGAIISFEHWNH